MDSIEFNKIAAAILIALLVVKGADLVAENLIHPKMLKENVFQIQGVVESSPTNGETEKKGPAPIEPLLVSASAQNGAIIFKKCTSCHTIEKGGPNKIGPDLYGVVGAPKAKHPGYTYSAAMEKKGGSWNYDDLNVYLYSPRDFVPGTKMSFAGIKDDKERADLIAYLREQNDAPPPLPKPVASSSSIVAPASAPAKPVVPPVPVVKPAAPVPAAPAPAEPPATPPVPAKPVVPPVPVVKPAAPVPAAPAPTKPPAMAPAPAKPVVPPVPVVKPAVPVPAAPAPTEPPATPPAPAKPVVPPVSVIKPAVPVPAAPAPTEPPATPPAPAKPVVPPVPVVKPAVPVPAAPALPAKPAAPVASPVPAPAK